MHLAAQFLLLLPCKETFAAALTNSINVPFTCRGGPGNRLGRGGEAQRSHLCRVLHGFTICAPSPPPPPSSHMFLPPTNVPSRPSSHLPCHTSQRKRIKKTHKSFPWLPPGLPGQERRVGGRRTERLTELISFIPTQVSFRMLHTSSNGKKGEEKNWLKLENLIYLIISQNN